MYVSLGKTKCLLCSETADLLPNQDLVTHLYCKNCGEYNITMQAVQVLEFCQNEIKYILSSQTFEKNYYEQKPLTILAEDINNAKDIPLLEKLFKLSKYLYHETKKTGLGSKINDISYSRFFCRNDDEFIQLLETLKSNNIIDIIKKKGTIADIRPYIYSPVLLGNAMLAFEEGIDNIEDFKKAFMNTKSDRNQYNISFQEGKNQLNLATDSAKITASQNNSFDINELNTLIENAVKSLPKNISDEKRNEAIENLEFIKTEIQTSNPRTAIIKNTLSALKATAATAGFLASLAKIFEFLGFKF